MFKEIVELRKNFALVKYPFLTVAIKKYALTP